ncbi:MAG TPA: ureidoglycolate lyase [Caproiciproducens sp.]|nr:ureidoglycolate lyase [Caproiciproducens sp.]
MYKIKAQKLSPEKFRKYGEYIDLLDNESMKQASVFPENFFADLIHLNFGKETLPTISVCDVKKSDRNIVSFLEAHQFTCEGLLPLDGDVVIFTGILKEKFSVQNLEAFYVPRGTFVKLNPLIVHGTQYPVKDAEVHIVCMLPERTFKNDMMGQRLTDEEKAEITF